MCSTDGANQAERDSIIEYAILQLGRAGVKISSKQFEAASQALHDLRERKGVDLTSRDDIRLKAKYLKELRAHRPRPVQLAHEHGLLSDAYIDGARKHGLLPDNSTTR